MSECEYMRWHVNACMCTICFNSRRFSHPFSLTFFLSLSPSFLSHTTCTITLSFSRSSCSLFLSDYTGCLRRLMRFPPVEDVRCIVQKALSIRNPDDIPDDPLHAHDDGI